MDNSERLKLYERLLMIREAENLIIAHYREDEMRTPMHMSMGQEAPSVAVCAALRDDDFLFGFYRSHALYIARTGDAEKFFLELYGKAGGACDGKGGSMHLACSDRGLMFTSAIVGGSIPAALGAAFAQKRKGTGGIAVAFFGDGACDQGVFWESLNAACAMRLPVLFVCEDNGLAVHSPSAVRCGYNSIVDTVSTFRCGVQSQLPGGDVDRYFHDITWAVSRVREGDAPVFLHLPCHRWLDHIGIEPHFDESFRPRADHDIWVARDPLMQLRRAILTSGFSDPLLVAGEDAIRARLLAAFEAAKTASFPTVDNLLSGVYAAEHRA